MNLQENPYRYAYGYMSEGHVIAQHIVLDKRTYNPVSNKYVYDGYIYDPTIGKRNAMGFQWEFLKSQRHFWPMKLKQSIRSC